MKSKNGAMGFDAYNLCGTGEASMTITAKRSDTHHVPVVCIALQGNIIDRNPHENGCGWRKGCSFTLNSTDRHGVCFQVESIGHDMRSTQFSKNGCCDTLTSTDYKEPLVVAYEKQQTVLIFKERAGKPGGGKGILIGENKGFTLATNPIEALCYEAPK